MSSSSSNSSTSTFQRDARVAADNGALGISSEGPVRVNIVPDQAFNLGRQAVTDVRRVAEGVNDLAEDAIANSLRLVGNTAGDAQDITSQTISAAGGLVRSTNATLADALTRTIEADKTEEGQISSQLIKIGIPAVAIAVVAIMVFRR